jgi:hypothetical protein
MKRLLLVVNLVLIALATSRAQIGIQWEKQFSYRYPYSYSQKIVGEAADGGLYVQSIAEYDTEKLSSNGVSKWNILSSNFRLLPSDANGPLYLHFPNRHLRIVNDATGEVLRGPSFHYSSGNPNANPFLDSNGVLTVVDDALANRTSLPVYKVSPETNELVSAFSIPLLGPVNERYLHQSRDSLVVNSIDFASGLSHLRSHSTVTGATLWSHSFPLCGPYPGHVMPLPNNATIVFFYKNGVSRPALLNSDGTTRWQSLVPMFPNITTRKSNVFASLQTNTLTSFHQGPLRFDSVDLSDGRLLSSLQVDTDTFYFFDKTGQLIRFSSNTGNGTVTSYNPRNFSINWSIPIAGPLHDPILPLLNQDGLPLVFSTFLDQLDPKYGLLRIDARTGDILWQKSSDRIMPGSGSGGLVLTSSNSSIIRTYEHPNSAYATFVNDQGEVQRQIFLNSDQNSYSPLTHSEKDGVIYMGSELPMRFSAINAATGNVLYSVPTSFRTYHELAFAYTWGNEVRLYAETGIMARFRKSDGTQLESGSYHPFGGSGSQQIIDATGSIVRFGRSVANVDSIGRNALDGLQDWLVATSPSTIGIAGILASNRIVSYQPNRFSVYDLFTGSQLNTFNFHTQWTVGNGRIVPNCFVLGEFLFRVLFDEKSNLILECYNVKLGSLVFKSVRTTSPFYQNTSLRADLLVQTSNDTLVIVWGDGSADRNVTQFSKDDGQYLGNAKLNSSGFSFFSTAKTHRITARGSSILTLNSNDQIRVGNYAVSIKVHDPIRSSSFSVERGSQHTGNLASLDRDDDYSLMVLCDESDSFCEVTIVAIEQNPRMPNLELCSRSKATRQDCLLSLDLFDWSRDQFVNVSMGSMAIHESLLKSVELPKNAYLRASDRQIKARLRAVPLTEIDAFDGWTFSFDQFVVNEISD